MYRHHYYSGVSHLLYAVELQLIKERSDGHSPHHVCVRYPGFAKLREHLGG
jgi:hypothetical protein